MGAHGSKEKEREREGAVTPSCRVRISSLRKGSGKKRGDSTRANSPLSDASLSSPATHAPPPGRRQTPQKNGAPEMKTPALRKQPPRRAAPVLAAAKPAPLRDHNRVAGSGAAPGGKLLPPPPPPPAVPHLRHSAAGFQALAVLVHYLVNDLDAFATPQLKAEVEKMRLELINRKQQLDEAFSKKRKLEEKVNEQETLYQKELADVEKTHRDQITELISQHETQIAEFEKKILEQTEQTRCRYEGELSRLERLHAEREAALLEDGVSRLQQAEAEHKCKLQESEKRAEELRERLQAADEETARLQLQVAGLVSGQRQDRCAQLQVTAGRCHDLQEEVRSLHTVLDLRHKELAEVRRQNAELQKDAGELPTALQRIATLQARVEDLQEQLQLKVNFERQLYQENRKLNESFHHVAVQKEKLSQHNEELKWKLKQSSEAVHVFTQALTAMPHISHSSRTNTHKLIDPFPRDDSQTQEISKSYTKLCSQSPLMQRRGDRNNSHLLQHELDHPSPPSSPKVKVLVEKSDSVSWVLDMDESPEAKVSRLVRRANSFRASSNPFTPLHAQSQTLPRSHGASGPAKRQSTGNIAAQCRTRARSVSSPESFSSSCLHSSTPISMYHSMSEKQSSVAHSLRDECYMMSSGKMPLKRCSGDADECSLDGEDDEDDVIRQHQNSNGIVAKRSNAENINLTMEGQRLSSHSGGSSNSSCASSTGSSTSSSCSEPEQNYRHLNGSIIYREVETDATEMRVLPLPPLPGSTDLSLLAAACAAAKPLLGAPKDAAGEAMISEETLDNENDANEVDTSSDNEDPHSWGNVGLLPSDNEG